MVSHLQERFAATKLTWRYFHNKVDALIKKSQKNLMGAVQTFLTTHAISANDTINARPIGPVIDTALALEDVTSTVAQLITLPEIPDYANTRKIHTDVLAFQRIVSTAAEILKAPRPDIFGNRVFDVFKLLFT